MDIPKLRADARRTLQGRPHAKVLWLFLLLGEIPFLFYLLSYAANLFIQAIPGGLNARGTLSTLAAVSSALYIIYFVGVLAAQLLNYGFAAYLLKLCRGKNGSKADLFVAFRRLGHFVGLFLMTFVLEMLWSFLLIIPGIIAIYRYSQAVFLMVDDPELTPGEAIAKSARMTAGHKGELFRLDLCYWYYFVLLNIAAGTIYLYNLSAVAALGQEMLLALLCGGEVLGFLVSFWLVSEVSAVRANAYRALRGEYAEAPETARTADMQD